MKKKPPSDPKTQIREILRYFHIEPNAELVDTLYYDVAVKEASRVQQEITQEKTEESLKKISVLKSFFNE